MTVKTPTHTPTHIMFPETYQRVLETLDETHRAKAVELAEQVARLTGWERLRKLLDAGVDFDQWQSNVDAYLDWPRPSWHRIVTAVLELLDYPVIEGTPDAALYWMSDVPDFRLQCALWAAQTGNAGLFRALQAEPSITASFIAGIDEQGPRVVH